MTQTANIDTRKELAIPRPLHVGDAVAVVAPCSPPAQNLLDEGVRFLRALGLKATLGAHIRRRRDYLAGSDSERAEDLNAAFANPEIRAVFFARGGYGCMRILDRLDLQALAADPKIVCGMSDAVAIQLYLYKELGLVTFSGPMVAGQLGGKLDLWSEKSYLRGLFQPWTGRQPSGAEQGKLTAIRPGRGAGPLIGGCLSIVSALVGTPYFPDLSGAILLLEDVNEPLYRLDRMFTQLRLAGIYDSISGMVLGHFIAPDGRDLGAEVETLVYERTQQFDFPIVSRFPHGHRLPNLTLPHGMHAELDASGPSLEFVS
ncbi:MAG: S66 peptidase family protein [Desulfomonilaceae bacterium]